MDQSINDERVQRYGEALGKAMGCHNGAACDECVAGADAVMAVVDAEQAELRAKVERLKRNTAGLYARAHAAEARLARVDALADKWSAAYEVQHRTEAPTVAQIQLGRMAEALKVALGVSTPDICGRCGAPALGFATIRGDRYCHADERSCYTEQCRDDSVA